MAPLTHERYCAAITTETALLRATVRGADPDRQVPTCPAWTLRELAVHVGRAHRWAAETVRVRATAELPEDAGHVPGFEPPAGADGLDGWLEEGAAVLAAALREAGPEQPVWTWAGPHRAAFWARRMAVETLVHRADAALAAERPYTAEPDLAADGLDEWLALVTAPEQVAGDPELHELLGTGQTLHLVATDVPDAEWLIVRGPERITVRRGLGDVSGPPSSSAVVLRATLTDLLLVFQRRLPLDGGRLEILGDRGLLEHWLERTRFGSADDEEPAGEPA